MGLNGSQHFSLVGQAGENFFHDYFFGSAKDFFFGALVRVEPKERGARPAAMLVLRKDLLFMMIAGLVLQAISQ